MQQYPPKNNHARQPSLSAHKKVTEQKHVKSFLIPDKAKRLMIIIALLGMLVSNSKRRPFRGEPMKHKRMMDACARGQWRRSRGSSASRKYTKRQRPSRRSSRSCLRRAAGGSPAARIGYAYLNNSERAKPAFLDLMSCFTLKSIRTKKSAYYPFPKNRSQFTPPNAGLKTESSNHSINSIP